MTDNLTPRQVVEELDRYIIGQGEAKRAVAVAIRNRWRRLRLPEELREEVAPKNIIMIGRTGVGKTEIARRLAGLVKAPFLKVELSKYTEVGYYGRDVESMIRDLVELSVAMVRSEATHEVERKAEELAEERLVDLLLPPPSRAQSPEDAQQTRNARDLIRAKLADGKIEERIVELSVEEKAVPMQVFSTMGLDQMDFDFQSILEKVIPSKKQERKVTVADARKILIQQESEKLIDKERVARDALTRAQNHGIVFLDEIDKIAGKESGHGPDVSRAGVQRDLLPIVEGATVATRHGLVRTDHILFIAAGAFHMNKPSDLIPELQGRFPIRVELSALTKEDFVRILTEPKNALTTQYRALLATEEIELEFKPDAVDAIAEIATVVNQRTTNIGARRLHTIMERLLEEVSFDAPDLAKQKISIGRDYVNEKLASVAHDEDLSKYIL